MESAVLSSDDSCDSEMKAIRSELIDFGLGDENMSKDEMRDLLKALKDSKSEMDEVLAHNTHDATDSKSPVSNPLKRQYKNVRDRRLPWSLFSKTLTQAEKARTLAVYIELMAINSYRQARQSPKFSVWPPPIQIVDENTRTLPFRSTRSGRTVPVYADFDDDSTDMDFVIAKPKKRKLSTTDHNGTDTVYLNKVHSLKRKNKEDNDRPTKEVKISTEDDIIIEENDITSDKNFISLNKD